MGGNGQIPQLGSKFHVPWKTVVLRDHTPNTVPGFSYCSAEPLPRLTDELAIRSAYNAATQPATGDIFSIRYINKLTS